jgi:hypothetical protein
MGAELDMNTSSLRFTRLLVGATALALPFAADGCTQTACFVWTAQEGTCPVVSEAMKYFSGDDCNTGHVASVEGPGTASGQLCCYPVTYSDRNRNVVCGPSGAGGFGGGVVVVDGSGGFVDVGGAGGAGGFGGTGGMTSCQLCEEGIIDPNIATDGICPDSLPVFEALFDCACSGPCASVCSDPWCTFDAGASSDCVECMKLAAPDGCATELDDCLNDI